MNMALKDVDNITPKFQASAGFDPLDNKVACAFDRKGQAKTFRVEDIKDHLGTASIEKTRFYSAENGHTALEYKFLNRGGGETTNFSEASTIKLSLVRESTEGANIMTGVEVILKSKGAFFEVESFKIKGKELDLTNHSEVVKNFKTLPGMKSAFINAYNASQKKNNGHQLGV